MESETTYNLSFVTEYGDQKSDPIYLTFKTAALPAGGIAGISIGMKGWLKFVCVWNFNMYTYCLFHIEHKRIVLVSKVLIKYK